MSSIAGSSTRTRSASESTSIPDKYQNKKGSISSQVTFASLFGDDEGDPEVQSVSSEQTNEVTVLPRANSSRCNLLMEHVMLLFLLSSAITRENLKRAFRIIECTRQYGLSVKVCENEFKRRFSDVSDIADMTEYILDARLAMEYLAGALLIFLLSQYVVRYGYRMPLLVCASGALASNIFIGIYLGFSEEFGQLWAFLAALPLILTGGDVLVITLVSVNIGANSAGKSNRRWRFLLFEVYRMVPEILSRLSFVFWPNALGPPSFSNEQIFAVVLSLIVLLVVLCFKVKSLENQRNKTLVERLRHTCNSRAFRTTLNCFTKYRPNKSRKQILLLFSIATTAYMCSDVFSDLRLRLMSLQRGWSTSYFVIITSIGLAVCFGLTLFVEALMLLIIRPIDPTVVVAGLIAHFLSSLLLAASYFQVYFYYIGIGLTFMVILGRVALRSHLCQIAEKHEYPPLFGLMFAIEKSIHIVFSMVWRSLSEVSVFNGVYYAGNIFVMQSLVLIMPVIAAMCIRYITKSSGYPYYAYLIGEEVES